MSISIGAAELENVWTISSPIGGTSVTANYVLGTVSGNTICGILNPAGSPKTVFVKRTILTVVTGTLVTGAFVWGVASAGNVATITSTGKEPIRHWVATTATGKHNAYYYAGDTT